jgi:hypothetical protein
VIFADLGPSAVEVDGLSNPVGGRRPASVPALLLARAGEVVTPAALVDTVSGESAPARAHRSLEWLAADGSAVGVPSGSIPLIDHVGGSPTTPHLERT